MKKTSLFASLLLGAAIAASPAVAKTTITKGKQICETAAKGQEPAPKSVRTISDETRSYDALIVYTLRVKNADDSAAVLTCSVNRDTAEPTLKPAP